MSPEDIRQLFGFSPDDMSQIAEFLFCAAVVMGIIGLFLIVSDNLLDS